MKFPHVRAQQSPPKAEPPKPEAPKERAVVSYALYYEKKGTLSRGRLVLPDGTETVTQWRAYDHGLVGEVRALLRQWSTAGILGGMMRVPRDAKRQGQ